MRKLILPISIAASIITIFAFFTDHHSIQSLNSEIPQQDIIDASPPNSVRLRLSTFNNEGVRVITDKGRHTILKPYWLSQAELSPNMEKVVATGGYDQLYISYISGKNQIKVPGIFKGQGWVKVETPSWNGNDRVRVSVSIFNDGAFTFHLGGFNISYSGIYEFLLDNSNTPIDMTRIN